ncbi:peptidoglycan-binding protein [Actinomadura kijaniata]|uniref:peptidoglycan-binding protein n=1 Tax=Actinomadura kijaniata TaxID=46161 RepID=UPI0008352F7E|nr:efflux RND transporter periplasmic adaptor subunit [Actinomadura kijaniata]
MRRRTLLGVAAAVAVAAGTGIAVTTTGDGPPKATAVPLPTVPVERGDLSEGTTVDGTLGYGGERKIKAGAAGTLTWLPGAGTVLRRGDRLYELDGRPVRLMYGERPMYRVLRTGSKGPDVRRLEENLNALGYGGALTVDGSFTRATADAVDRWRRANGHRRGRTAGPEQIVFAPGPVRVGSRDAAAGDRAAPGTAVLTASGSRRTVAFRMKVAEAGLVRRGTRITVDLPGGGTARGTVRLVGARATRDEDGTSRIEVLAGLDDPDRAGGLDQAPVTVTLATRTRRDVLSVPVQALLALPGGGYGVRIVAGGARRTAEVEVGVFGGGRVEVRGDGVAEGTRVEVPES